MHVGNIKLGTINTCHRRADIGIILGIESLWGKGYACEAIEALASYAFGSLRLHKLTAGCYASNTGSLRAFLKAGFVQEGLQKEQCFLENQWEDVALLGMIAPPEIYT
jgi:RimJ/RimL family protein N-acetyltransferase